MIGAFLLLQLFSGMEAASHPVPDYVTKLEACDPSAEITQPCAVPLRHSPEVILAKLGSRSYTWWFEGDRLTVVAKLPEEGWAMLCCAIQGQLEPVGSSGLAGLTVRVPRVDEALLDVAVHSGGAFEPPQQIRGNKAAPAPRVVEALRGTITKMRFPSSALGEGRGLTIYVPPDVRTGEKLPVIYLADGETASSFARIAEASALDVRSARAIIVGIHNASGASSACLRQPCDKRMLDYLPNATAAGTERRSPFGMHMAFIADELVPWVERNYPASNSRENRILAGFSNGAVWAFSTAALRPEMFGKILAMSSGNASTTGLAANIHDAQIYAGAGTFEPKFLESTKRRAELARRSGSRVKFREIVSGHSHGMWDILFADGLAWLLPPLEVRGDQGTKTRN